MCGTPTLRSHYSRFDSKKIPFLRSKAPYFWTGYCDHNIEFSCRPGSDRYAPVRRAAFFRSRPRPGGQLQRFVIHTPTANIAIGQVTLISLITRSGRQPCTLMVRCYPSASTMALGFSAATISSARAGPSGLRRPCSQFCRVATLTPIIYANSL
jgi:hypothetical protein